MIELTPVAHLSSDTSACLCSRTIQQHYTLLPLVDLILLVPDLLLDISTEARLLSRVSFANPVDGVQSANGDLKNDLVGAAASAASGFTVTGSTPPGTTPSDVCSGTTSILCPLLLEAGSPLRARSELGLKRCLKLLRVPDGAREGVLKGPEWLCSGPLPWR